MRRICRLIVSLYPTRWRVRYATELEALLEDINPGCRDLVNIMSTGFQLHLRRVGLRVFAVSMLLGAIVAGGVFLATPARGGFRATIDVVPADGGNADATGVVTRAFTDARLASLMEANGLYSPERATRPASDLIGRFRRDIGVTLATTDAPARSQLTVSFSYPDAQKAQSVTTRLVSLVIAENVERRQGAAPNFTILRVTGAPEPVRSAPDPSRAAVFGVIAAALTSLVFAAVGRRRSRDTVGS